MNPYRTRKSKKETHERRKRLLMFSAAALILLGATLPFGAEEVRRQQSGSAV